MLANGSEACLGLLSAFARNVDCACMKYTGADLPSLQGACDPVSGWHVNMIACHCFPVHVSMGLQPAQEEDIERIARWQPNVGRQQSGCSCFGLL